MADTLLGHFVGGRIVRRAAVERPRPREIDKVFVVACGTAYHSGLLAKYAIEHWTRLPVDGTRRRVRYRDRCWTASTQCGDLAVETRHAGSGPTPRAESQVLAITAPTARPARVRRGALHPRGPEIGVASTKTFLAQIAANYLLGLAPAQARGKYPDEVEREYHELEAMPDRGPGDRGDRWPAGPPVRPVVDRAVLGRHVGYPVALEVHSNSGWPTYVGVSRPAQASRQVAYRYVVVLTQGRPRCTPSCCPTSVKSDPRCDHRDRRGGQRNGAPTPIT